MVRSASQRQRREEGGPAGNTRRDSKRRGEWQTQQGVRRGRSPSSHTTGSRLMLTRGLTTTLNSMIPFLITLYSYVQQQRHLKASLHPSNNRCSISIMQNAGHAARSTQHHATPRNTTQHHATPRNTTTRNTQHHATHNLLPT